MFTGIIKQIGTVTELTRMGDSARLGIDAQFDDQLEIGESISVNGACLTVEQVKPGKVWFTLTPETLQRTTLGRLSPGDRVNLERALQMGDRLGGHLIAGHVDGVGRAVAMNRRGDSAEAVFEFSEELAPYLAPKGSVAVDGVSLTVVDLSDTRFTVALVKHTLESTTLGQLKPGDQVNIEADLLARYLERLLQTRGEKDNTKREITWDLLAEQGYL